MLTPLAAIFLQNTLKSWSRGSQTLHTVDKFVPISIKIHIEKETSKKLMIDNNMWYTYMGILNELVTRGNW